MGLALKSTIVHLAMTLQLGHHKERAEQGRPGGLADMLGVRPWHVMAEAHLRPKAPQPFASPRTSLLLPQIGTLVQ